MLSGIKRRKGHRKIKKHVKNGSQWNKGILANV